MKAGELNKRLAFQVSQNQSDGQGGFFETWSTLFTRWAAIQPQSWNEAFENNQSKAMVQGVVKIRSDPQTRLLDSSYRAVYQNRIFDLKGMADIDEENRFICLNYEELI